MAGAESTTRRPSTRHLLVCLRCCGFPLATKIAAFQHIGLVFALVRTRTFECACGLGDRWYHGTAKVEEVRKGGGDKMASNTFECRAIYVRKLDSEQRWTTYLDYLIISTFFLAHLP